MSLFVARHQHAAETCPAKDPAMGKMLLDHLGAANAQQHGDTIHGEAVLDGQHTLWAVSYGLWAVSYQELVLSWRRAMR